VAEQPATGFGGMLLNTALPLLATLLGGLLLSRRLRENLSWRATVTPLASIIGSGFLVVAPILGQLLGRFAIVGMLVIALFAIAIGTVLRFNIRHAEARLARGDVQTTVIRIERAADAALTLAYVISVAFYVRLLAAFLLRPIGLTGGHSPDLLATMILSAIGLIGWRRGLHALEDLEEYAVAVKLAVIAALITGLAVHAGHSGFHLSGIHSAGDSPWRTSQVLAGLLLVVQGFETSRFLGQAYTAELRIRTMLRAQWLASAIYLLFVLLATPLFDRIAHPRLDETAIIDLATAAAWVLGPMLVLAAIMSQFSAAVADTVGAGGLVKEESAGRIVERQAYLVIVALAIALIWSANLFEIISLASRAFAFYYLLQTMLAWLVAGDLAGSRGLAWRRAGFAAIAAVLCFVVVFGRPAD